MAFVTMTLIVVACILLYFLPSLMAAKRNHPSSGGIFVMNFFLGWTFIFWVFALIWACSDNARRGTVVFIQNPGANNIPVYPQTSSGAPPNNIPAPKALSNHTRKVGFCLLAISIILIAVVIVHTSNSTDPNPALSSPRPSRISEANEAPIAKPKELPDAARKISAPMLWRIYHENEVSADSDFKGSLMEVYGVVTEISKDAFGSEIIGLRTANEFESARAYLDKEDESEVSILRKGDVISVVCVGGGLIIGSPVLRKCHIHEGAVISPSHAEWDDLTPAEWKRLGFELAPKDPDSGVSQAPSDVKASDPTNQ